MRKILTIILLINCLSIGTTLAGNKKSVAVKGKVMCNDKPAKDVLVSLYNIGFFWDTLLEEKKTESDGEYYLSSGEAGTSSSSNRLYFDHNCNDPFPCQRLLKFEIPKKYVTEGNATRPYNFGIFQLGGVWNLNWKECV